MGANSFPRNKRLLNAADFKQVFDAVDCKASHRHLLLLGKLNQRADSRLGLVIAKKHVKLAVQRNRIKRLSREIFRCFPASGQGVDVIVLTRPGIDRLDNAALSSILLLQLQKLVAT